LIALNRYLVGGAETQALYLAIALRKRGYEVFIGAFGSENGEGLKRFIKEGFDCARWGFQEKLVLNPKPGIFNSLRKWRFSLQLIWKVRRLKVDHVIPFTYPVNMLFCRWYNRMGIGSCFWNQRDEGRQFLGAEKEIRVLENA